MKIYRGSRFGYLLVIAVLTATCSSPLPASTAQQMLTPTMLAASPFMVTPSTTVPDPTATPSRLPTLTSPLLTITVAPTLGLLTFTSREPKRSRELCVSSLEKFNPTCITDVVGERGFVDNPIISKDGKFVLFTSDKGNVDGMRDIYSWNLEDRSTRRLTFNFYISSALSWAPDGKSVVFVANNSPYRSRWDIYTLSPIEGDWLKGSCRITRITNFDATDFFILGSKWSPDGNHIVYDRENLKDGQDAIYQIDLRETIRTPQRIGSNPDPSGYDASPDWSPDGTAIVFQSERNGNTDIYKWSAGNISRLTNDLAHDRAPVWSPDGQKIAFTSDRDGERAIYVMNADGSEQKKLTTTPLPSSGVEEDYPVWSSDGRSIFFSSEVRTNFTRNVYHAYLDMPVVSLLATGTESFSVWFK